MASCSGDETVKVWDTLNDFEVSTLNGHTKAVYSLALLPNGWLASGSEDTTIELWDLEESKELRTLQGHISDVVSFKVLHNGNLVSYSLDDTIKIWDPYTAENNLLLTITGHGNINSIIVMGIFSSDLLLTNSGPYEVNEASTLRVWDSNDGRLVKSLPTGLADLWTILVLHNDQIVVSTRNGTIKIIDLEDASQTRVKAKAHDEVTCLLQLSNDILVSAGEEKQSSSFSRLCAIKVWNLGDLSLLQSINSGHSGSIYSLSISSDQTLLASGSLDETIKLWSISNI